jgi:hypothetical protein
MKKKRRNQWRAVVAGLVATAGLGPMVQGQSSDALLDKLVDKGILTVKEANELREESDKGFNQAYQVKTGLPDWVTSLKINGDFRGRYENIGPNSGAAAPGTGTFDQYMADRNRFRYRMRVGLTAVMHDHFEVGMRLSSSEAANGGSGGDPISGNTTMGSNGSKKFVYLDLAYGKWTPINDGDWTTAFTVGKMENPFTTSDMVFDGDYTPEGFAEQFGYNINRKHALKLNLGEFAILEDGKKARDPFLFGSQLRWDATWTPKWQSSMGVAGYALTDSDRLVTSSVPDQNKGNERNKAGKLANSYNPVVADASVTYNLTSFPLYTGTFPIKLGTEYMNNPAADHANEGYWAGVFFGKSGKKGTWDLSYRYKELQGDAWYEEFVDSDFGAYYSSVNPALPRGSAGGYAAGTNVRGHIIKASYSPYDSLTLAVTYFLTEVIDQPVAKSEPTGRLQIDATLKF